MSFSGPSRLHFDPLKLIKFNFNADPDPAFFMNADPDPKFMRIGFGSTTLTANTKKNCIGITQLAC